MNIILSKESSESDLRRYFQAVLEISKRNEDYPVNLEEVWMLVYGKKGDAVTALKRTFVEGVDYVSVQAAAESAEAVNNRNSRGQFTGQNKVDYHLTTSCLEYFIARKVRPVFEIYREVFHKVAENKAVFDVPQTFADALLLAAKQQQQIEHQQAQIEAKEQENEEQRVVIEQKNATIELQTNELKKSAPKVDYYDQTLQSKSTMTISEIGNEFGLSGKELNKRLVAAGIIYKRDATSSLYLLKKPYSEWGMAQTRTRTFTRSDGSIGTDHLTVYNERGRRFIVALHECGYDAKAALSAVRGE